MKRFTRTAITAAKLAAILIVALPLEPVAMAGRPEGRAGPDADPGPSAPSARKAKRPPGKTARPAAKPRKKEDKTARPSRQDGQGGQDKQGDAGPAPREARGAEPGEPRARPKPVAPRPKPAARPPRRPGRRAPAASAGTVLPKPRRSKKGKGPSYIVERIVIKGNSKTQKSVIRRHLAIKRGMVVYATDSRIQDSKYKLLGLGHFRHVNFFLKRGSKKGYAILVVEVSERGTIVLNSLFWGFSRATPFWGGLDLSENNFLGRGMVLSGALVVGSPSKIEEAELQYAWQLRFSAPYFLGSKFGLSAMFLHTQATEFFRKSGRDTWTEPKHYIAARYRRIGGLLGTGVDMGRFNRVSLEYRFEAIDTVLPANAVRTFPDEPGVTRGIDFDLDPARSYLSSFLVTFHRDKRNDAVLPTAGYNLLVTGELGAEIIGSSYSFAKVTGIFQKWWPLPGRRHAISLQLLGGVIVGRTPLFNKFFVGDISDLLPPRALELNFSTLNSRDIFNTIMESMRYETIAGRIAVEYSLSLFRRKHHVYGGDLFFRIGVFGLMSRQHFRQRETSLREAIPLDMTFDAGLRLDTAVGIFTLSVANALGRVPF